MPALQRAVRLLLATIVGIVSGLFLPIPGWLAPTFAVIAFVAVCFLLRCALIWSTIVFALVVAAAPTLTFAVGLSSHNAVAESLGQAFEGFASHPQLLLMFLVAPIIVGGLLHFLLHRALSRNVHS